MSELYIPNSIALRNFDSIFSNNTFDFTDKEVSIRFHSNYVAMHPIVAAENDVVQRVKVPSCQLPDSGT